MILTIPDRFKLTRPKIWVIGSPGAKNYGYLAKFVHPLES